VLAQECLATKVVAGRVALKGALMEIQPLPFRFEFRFIARHVDADTRQDSCRLLDTLLRIAGRNIEGMQSHQLAHVGLVLEDFKDCIVG
jgi:hypothetical protein